MPSHPRRVTRRSPLPIGDLDALAEDVPVHAEAHGTDLCACAGAIVTVFEGRCPHHGGSGDVRPGPRRGGTATRVRPVRLLRAAPVGRSNVRYRRFSAARQEPARSDQLAGAMFWLMWKGLVAS